MKSEAKALAFLKKKAFRKIWEARLLQENEGPSVHAFEAAVALLEELHLPYIPIQGLLAGPLDELVARIERLAGVPADSPVIPAALGVCDLPHVNVRDMPKIMEERCAHKLRGKHRDQLRQWRNRYKHAARIFAEVVSNKEGPRDHRGRRAPLPRAYGKRGSIPGIYRTIRHVKRLRYMRQMVDEYHNIAGTLPSQIFNPFNGFKIKRRPKKKKKSSNQGGKPALPVSWVKSLVSGKLTEGIETDERVDIGVVVAETGCRQTEIVSPSARRHHPRSPDSAPPGSDMLKRESTSEISRTLRQSDLCPSSELHLTSCVATQTGSLGIERKVASPAISITSCEITSFFHHPPTVAKATHSVARGTPGKNEDALQACRTKNEHFCSAIL